MPIKPDREYRILSAPMEPAADTDFVVRGYATTFDDPYVLYEYEGNQYKEVIDRHALDEADMSDVIMQYDHSGRVFARQSNGSLKLTPDEHGLKIEADLSRSAGAKELYEEIKAGLITKMSWAFSVDADEYSRSDRTRTITRVKRVYDVSAVSIPANPSTDIAARGYFDGVIEAEKAERLEAEQRERQKKKIKLLVEVTK